MIYIQRINNIIIGDKMKLTNLQKIIIALLVAPLVYAASYYLYTPLVKSSLESIMSAAKIDEEIFASKVATLNQVHSMYEKSNIIGFNNCIKLNPEAVCSKRMNQITNHFDNEYNTKLLKLLAEKSGVALNENGKTGKLTAVGKLSTNEGRLPYIAGKDLYISIETKEAISIGSKFAELGLKVQHEEGFNPAKEGEYGYIEKANHWMEAPLKDQDNNSRDQALKAYKSIMERLDLEEAQKGASGIETSPALMDTLTDTGKRFFNNAVLSPSNEAIISVSGCNGEELKTEFCTKFIEQLPKM